MGPPPTSFYPLYSCRVVLTSSLFRHPSVDKLSNLLRKARPDEFSATVHHNLNDIAKRCNTCQLHSSRPRRFKVTMGLQDIQFNHCVAVDVMYLNNQPVLHAVDEATHFQSARFMSNMSPDSTWKLLSQMWMQTYLGPPDYTHVDQGKNIVSALFKSIATAEGISVVEAPIECPTELGNVERCHGPLRITYDKIRSSLKKESKEAVLQMAVKCLNDTVGPEGLVPTLLVFGSLSRPARSIPAETQIERAKAMKCATKALTSEYAKSKVRLGLKYPGPFAGERHDLQDLQYGAPVLTYRTVDKRWTGPHKFVDLTGETVTVQTENGRKVFRSTVVKPYHSSSPACDDLPSTTQPHTAHFYFPEEESSFIKIYNNISDHFPFIDAQNSELQGLQSRGMFKVVNMSDVPP